MQDSNTMAGASGIQRAIIASIAMTAVLASLSSGVLAEANSEHDPMVTLNRAAIHRVAIDYGTDDALDDSQVFVYLADDTPEFRLQDMQPGESRSIAGPSGRPVLLTRVAEGLELNVDGRVFQLSGFHGGHRFTEVAKHDATVVDRSVLQAVQIIHPDTIGAAGDGIEIVSPDRREPTPEQHGPAHDDSH